MKISIAIRFIVVLALFVEINCRSVLESNGTAAEDLNVQTLIALGRELNNPLMTLMGKVIENYHVCTAWSNWTECGARRTNFFSTITRTRKCRENKLGTRSRAEIETAVCEGDTETIAEKVCPITYNMTANGFCMRLYTTGKAHDEAELVCKNDGGFLINIDSDEKYADVQTILIANDITSQIQIDGRRKNSISQWEYAYGSTSGYFHWYSGYPTTSSDSHCLRLTGYRTTPNQRFLTYNTVCNQPQPFLCEVLV